jgi:membrane protease YdiL (CAAX protease family)
MLIALVLGVLLFGLVVWVQLGGGKGSPAEGAGAAEAAGVAIAPADDMFGIMARALGKIAIGSQREGERFPAWGWGMLEDPGQSATKLIRLAIVEGAGRSTDDAIARLDDAESRLREDAEREDAGDAAGAQEAEGEGVVATREALASDIADLRTIYEHGTDGLDDETRARLVEHHGWFGELALAHGDDARIGELVKGWRRILYFATAMVVLLCAWLVAGLAMGTLAIVLIATGRLRWQFDPPAPGGSVYLEMFPMFIAMFLVVSVGMDLLGLALKSQFGWSIDAIVVARLVSQWLIVLVVAYPLLRGVRWSRASHDLGWHRGRGVVREVLAGIAGYLAGVPLLIGAALLTAALNAVVGAARGGPPPTPNNPVVDILVSASPVVIALLVVLATLWAPIVEETVFRGALYRHLRSRMAPVVAGLVSGTLFAFMHSYGWTFTPPLIALGFTFAMVREWRGSLIAPMTAHLLHNGTLMVMLVVGMQVA